MMLQVHLERMSISFGTTLLDIFMYHMLYMGYSENVCVSYVTHSL